MISPHRLIKFSIIGVSNTLISFALFYLALNILPESTIKGGLAQMISYPAGIIWSYYWNSRWTFQRNAEAESVFVLFVISQVSFMILSSLLVSIGIDFLDLMPLAVWLVVNVFIVLLNFVISSRIMSKSSQI